MCSKSLLKSLIIMALIISLLAPVKPILAADIFDLSYQLTEGGYRLEFNSTNFYKGVKVEVNTNVNAQYEVIQKVLRPLENRDKPGVFLANNFVVRGVIGTNQYGNLRIPTSDIPVRSNESLYVSNPAGNQDSFTLVYGLVKIEDLEPGYYSGQINLTLQPVSGSRAAVNKNLDVYVTISEQIGSQPKIEISTSSGIRFVKLISGNKEKQACDVIVKINGRFNNLFRVIQFLPQPLESKEGNRLDSNAVNFVVKEARIGRANNQNTPLSLQQQAIYTSSFSGEADSNFVITYSLGDLSRGKAGKYNSRIQYFREEKGMPTKLDTLDLEVEIERIFDVALTSDNYQSVIEFFHVKPGEAIRKSEVIVKINTNLGKQYQLIQNAASELINKQGDKIPTLFFKCRTESLNTLGKLKFGNNQEIKKGGTTLFVSDNKGSPDTFKVIYELSIPKKENIQAGDYSTRITYSLLEI